MNETSKLAVYKEVKKTLTAVTDAQGNTIAWSSAGAKGFQPPKGGPRLYLGEGSKQPPLKNLSHANLKTHLLGRLNARRAYLAEMELDEAKDTAGAEAEVAMAKVITSLLCPGMKHRIGDLGNEWFNERGSFKLADVSVKGTPGNFTFSYNIEYDFKAGATREIHIRGEFDAVTSNQIQSAMRNILCID